MTRLKDIDGLDYTGLIEHEQLLVWARNDRVRAYVLSNDKGRLRHDAEALCFAVLAAYNYRSRARVNNDDVINMMNYLMNLAAEERELGTYSLLPFHPACHLCIINSRKAKEVSP